VHIWTKGFSGRPLISQTSCSNSGITTTATALITHCGGERQIRTREHQGRSQISAPTDGNPTAVACIRHLSVDKIKSELDSGLSHGKQDDSRGLNDPPPQLGRELGLLSRLQLKYRSLRVAYVQPQLNNLFTQPFANRIDDAARPSAGMITTVLTRPAWAQPAVLPACLAQDHRACDRYDNKIHSP
jgi:hypothetical protein